MNAPGPPFKPAAGMPTFRWCGPDAPGETVIRIVFIVLTLVLAFFVIHTVVKASRSGRIDWTGVTAFIGFIVMAFYLRHVTGWG